ncbi:MAG: hypothetical protein AB7N80_01730 [Bdellovibrionales bacterium]
MSKTEGQQGLLKVMTGMVVLTGGLVALSLLATNPKEDGPTLTALARAPASLVGMALSTAKPAQALLERTSTLEFDCTPPQTATVTSEIKQLRLVGRLCGEPPTSTEVLNLTNGFTATIFTPKQGRFASDFIHLAEGENRLRVTYVMDSGERKTSDFQISRQPK